MHRPSLRWGLVVSLGIAALVGCAVGTDPNAIGAIDLTNVPVEGGDENSAALPPAAKPVEDAGAANPDTGTKSDAASDGGTDSGPGIVCETANTCPGATDLGSVSGDKGADTKTLQGSGSQWLKVRVTENDNSLDGAPLKVKAELQSPAGSNFDVFVYVPASDPGQECSAVTTSSTSTGAVDSASTSWGESSIPNGFRDDRTLTIEVRYVSGTCAPTAKWTLTLRGATL